MRLLTLNRGSLFCSTGLGNNKTLEVDGGEAKVVFRDPIFRVERSRSQVRTTMFRGFTEMQPIGGNRWQPQIIGPDEEATASGKDLKRVPFGRAAVEPRSQQAVRRFEAALPPHDFGLPPAAGSPSVERIRANRRLRYAIDPAAGPQSRQFMTSLFGFLSERWGVAVQPSGRRFDREADAVGTGRVDVVATPAQLPAGRSLPLFGDESEKVWLLTVNGQDPKFQDALRNFLTATLDGGEYGRRYLAAFGRLPNYEAVRPLIFPDPSASADPSPSASPTRGPSPEPSATPSPRPTRPAENPFRVTGVSLQAGPSSYSGSCPARFTFSGEVSTTGGPGTVRYRFLRSDGAADPEKTLTFSGPGSQKVSSTWELGGPGLTYSGWQAIQILEPAPQFESNRAEFTLTCSDVFRVTKASLQVTPASFTGTCPKQFTFNGEITTTGGSGTVRYRFIRSDGAIDRNERTLTFRGPGSQPVSTTWTLGGPGMKYSGWQAIEILEPGPRIESNRANFTLTCMESVREETFRAPS